MEKILVTGGRGFLASRFYSYYKENFDILLLEKKDLDITNKDKVYEFMKDYKPSMVLHTAAIADTSICENNPEQSFLINVVGTRNIGEACRDYNSKLIFLSTEQIFNGNEESGPYNETTIAKPNTVYGKHKLMAEEELKEILNELWILRLTWQFGFPERNKKVNANILWNVLSALIKGEKRGFPCNEYRGMTYVYDFLNNFYNILEIPYGIYNTGSENDLSTYEVALQVCEHMGLGHKAKDFILKDEERYKEKPRDIRITNKKLRSFGVDFRDTKEAIEACIRDFNFKP